MEAGIQQKNYELSKEDIEVVSHNQILIRMPLGRESSRFLVALTFYLQVFGMFGELEQVKVFTEEQYALITFKDIMCAFYA